jgi:hypothetical protein
MKKFLFVIMLIISTSCLHADIIDDYSNFVAMKHPEIYLSIQAMFYDQEREEAGRLVDAQCVNFMGCLDAYKYLPSGQKMYYISAYERAYSGKIVNWMLVMDTLVRFLEELEKTNSEGVDVSE